jgi:hypothetical protein
MVSLMTIGYGCKFITPFVAAAMGHWEYAILLSLTWIPARNYGGWIIVCTLVAAVVFAIGVHDGLRGLPFFGVLIPQALRFLAIPLVAREGLPIRLIHTKNDDDASYERDISESKLTQWHERIRAASGDRAKLEPVIFDMRDWSMTPSQAIRVAHDAGAPQALIEDIVQNTVLWPHLNRPRNIERGWAWQRAIDHQARRQPR